MSPKTRPPRALGFISTVGAPSRKPSELGGVRPGRTVSEPHVRERVNGAVFPFTDGNMDAPITEVLRGRPKPRLELSLPA